MDERRIAEALREATDTAKVLINEDALESVAYSRAASGLAQPSSSPTRTPSQWRVRRCRGSSKRPAAS
ncbi:MAG TPA: hypothetical protein VH231_05540 [Solirubrobacteraceae bacterium]|jgi:hypothetical protein|nr:hypothetical protein [Solirubrobacteraceae bacterium]